MMQEYMPPCPGNGMNITISIDLGNFLGRPNIPPCPPSEECEDKLTYFNENNKPKKHGFDKAMDNMKSKFDDKKENQEDIEDEKETKEKKGPNF